jgi:hypothetical protein
VRVASRKRSRSVDWAALLVPLIGLVVVWPLFTQSLPSTDDGALHLLRIAEIDRCLRHGVLPLRWAPDFAHGYGYPFFNYYASLSSYIGEIWHLVGLPFPQAVAAATICAVFFSGWGAYLLGRDILGWQAGLIAATSYMYAPYQFYDSAYRGNLAETWALALLPWVLWTGRRAAKGGRWADIVPCAAAYAALICTHNVMALIGSPILAVYLLVLWWTAGHSWPTARRLVALIALGLAMSAFFWLPAFLEKGWTRFSTNLVDYRTYFLSVRELFAWPAQVDLARLNSYPPRSLSWGMLILVGLGLALSAAQALRRIHLFPRFLTHNRTLETAFFLIVFFLASCMTLRLSDILWRTVPLIHFALIPWRYLGIASLAGSLVAGMVVAQIPDLPSIRSPALLVTCGAIVLLVATAIPWTYAAPFPQPSQVGVAQIVGWEYATGLIGTTAKNEYLPIWSSQLPADPADPALLTDADPIIARLDLASLPDGATVLSANYTLMRADLVIQSPRPFRALYRQLAFPGWKVTVDGTTAPLIALPPHGLLGFDVPAGTHRIAIRPVPTPLRLLGDLASALALLACLALLASGRVRQPAPGAIDVRYSLHWMHGLCLAALALGILAVKEGVIDRTENLFRAHLFDGAHVPGAQYETRVNFGNAFTMHGYDLPREPTIAGESLRVDLYLSAVRPADGEYVAYARLVDEDGRLYSLPYNDAPEGFRPPPSTTVWPGDAYGHWAYLVYTLPGTPPGEYWIQVGIFEEGNWHGLNVLDDSGQIEALAMRLGPVRIVRPRQAPDLDSLDTDRQAHVEVGHGMAYIGSAQDARSVHGGDTLNLTLFWQATGIPDEDGLLQLALVSSQATVPLGDRLPLGRTTHPTSAWRQGEVVRSPHALHLPPTVDAGTYAIQATVTDAQGRPISLPIAVGEITVEPTDRQMTVPPDIGQRVDADLGGYVTLLGYDWTQSPVGRGGSLPLTLYWQAQGEMQVSYKVFAQLLGPGGVLAQVDATPVDWKRPTTGWTAGEVVVDRYNLPIPADAPSGTYSLIVGMYDESTLQRLAVVDASGATTADHIELGQVTVE